MKQFLIGFACVAFLSGCFVFQKKEKYGCPTNGRNVGAEKIAAGDPAAMKASSKAKYKGRKSY